MDAPRKAALVVLLIVASSAAVSSAGDEGCWKDDDHHTFCNNEDCNLTCKDHGDAGGRCNWKWGRLLPLCQCVLPECKDKVEY